MKSAKKPMPSLRSDEEAEAFVATANLADYDLSGFKPVRFEFEPKSAGSKNFLTEWLRGVFRFNETQDTIEEKIRARIKWIFDYLRNMAVVGGFLFLGKVARNPILENLGFLGSGLLCAYLFTYFEPISLHPFHRLKNRQWAAKLNLLFNFLLFVPLMLALQFGLIYVINQLADANMAR